MRRRSGEIPERFLRLDMFWSRETAVILFLAVITGVGAGLGAVVFVQAIALLSNLSFEGGVQALGFLGRACVIILPALGGLMVGLILHFLAPHASRRGIPEVLAAMAERNGHLRPVVVLSQALGSMITIGTGGSVGQEGPVVQIGSQLGSTLATIFKLDEDWVIHLAASGAAGGIAALFGAPLAGTAFALEVVLGDIALETFPTILVSSITASIVSRAVLGESPAFALPTFQFESLWELILYLGLGVTAGLGAIAMIKALEFVENAFDTAKLPTFVKPAVGGFALGVLGFFVPQVLGVGFNFIERILTGDFTFAVLFMLFVGKLLATSLALGSGSPGGVMAPALFLGAALGYAYGEIARSILPDIMVSSSAYSIIGLTALFAAAARAP
ncbi:MAG: chloride channel protein [Acidobacteriota bacterium]